MKYCAVAAGALGLTTTDLVKLEKALATPVTDGGTQVVWLNGAACTGCTVSLANSAQYASIQDLLVPWVEASDAIGAPVSTLHSLGLTDYTSPTEGPLDLVFMETLSSAVGSGALNTAKSVLGKPANSTPFVLCIEGAIQTNEAGKFCLIGNSATYGAEQIAFEDEVMEYALDANCIAVLAIGTCASFGGIPASKGSVTGATGLISTGKVTGGYKAVNNVGLYDAVKAPFGHTPVLGLTSAGGQIDNDTWTGLMRKTICISGCPPHPDWIVGTIVYLLTYGEPPLMDKWHRPLDFYGQYQCTNCLWQTNTPGDLGTDHDITGAGKAGMVKGGVTTGNSPYLFLNKYNSAAEGCIGVMGCKGRKTKADCSYRRWNSTAVGGDGTSWCVQTRAGCHGCTEPRFPDGWGKFFSFK